MLSGILSLLLIPKTMKGNKTNIIKWYSISPKNKINESKIIKEKIVIENWTFVIRIFVIYKNPPNTGIIPIIGKTGITESVSNVSKENLNKRSGLW